MRFWLVLLLFCGCAEAAPYYNSSEAGCDGSDTNVLMCDDFEDGSWYTTDCDTSGGITNVANDGWCGEIAPPPDPAHAIICGPGVTPFGNCAGNAGTKGSPGEALNNQNEAKHHFKTVGCGTDATELCPVTTIYIRWYAKWVSGYSFGAEKHMNITNDDGDIAFANIQLNCGGGPASTAVVYVQVIHGEDMCDEVTGITIESNKWYFFEFRLTAHATNGTIQVWINDCGTDGTSCGASPTLRYNQSGLALPGNSNGSQIETIWLESWANAPSVGTGPYWDQLKVAIVGPIGFAAQDSDSGSLLEILLISGATLMVMLGGFLPWRSWRPSWGLDAINT